MKHPHVIQVCVCVCVYLLSHGGREQHGLSVVRTQSDDLLHLFLKVLIQHPEEETEPTGESVSWRCWLVDFMTQVSTCQPRPESEFRCESVQSLVYCEGDRSADRGWLSEHLDLPSMLPLEILGPTHLETHGQVI